MGKSFSIILIVIFLGCNALYSQCTPNGVKVQTPACQSPTSLQTTFIDCTKAKLEWKGQQSQEYIIELYGPDTLERKTIEVKKTDNACDSKGSCAVIVPVIAGAMYKWDVQSICTIDTVTLYSYKSVLQKAIIPTCKSIEASDIVSQASFQIFPNPVSRYLNINYKSQNLAKVNVSIFDVSGKQVLNKNIPGNSSGTYQLDLHELLPGNYVIKVSDGKETNHAKFVVVRQ